MVQLRKKPQDCKKIKRLLHELTRSSAGCTEAKAKELSILQAFFEKRTVPPPEATTSGWCCGICFGDVSPPANLEEVRIHTLTHMQTQKYCTHRHRNTALAKSF